MEVSEHGRRLAKSIEHVKLHLAHPFTMVDKGVARFNNLVDPMSQMTTFSLESLVEHGCMFDQFGLSRLVRQQRVDLGLNGLEVSAHLKKRWVVARIVREGGNIL